MPRMVLFDTRIGDRSVNAPSTNNYAATTDPTVSNDTSQGYEVGSTWVNTTAGRSWTCLSNSTGAAVWVLDGQSGSGGFGVQGTPTARTTSGQLTAAQLLTGI